MKKVMLVLGIIALLVVGTAAFAADGGHGSVNVDLSHGSATQVTTEVAAAIGAHPIVSGVQQAVTEEHVRTELAEHFTGSDIGSLVSLALPVLTGGQPGHNVVQVDHEEFSDFSADNINLFLRHHEGDSAIKVEYAYPGGNARRMAAEIPAGTYAFVDENGENPSPIATAGSNHLLLHLEDNSDYDHNRAVGVVEAHPQFAAANAIDGGGDDDDGSGGGGCDAGFSGVAAMLALAGAAIMSRKARG
jgi:hypothetical protein